MGTGRHGQAPAWVVGELVACAERVVPESHRALLRAQLMPELERIANEYWLGGIGAATGIIRSRQLAASWYRAQLVKP